MTKYKNALNCKKCPESAIQPDGCPMWWELLMTNDITGEKKVERGCGFQLLPQLLTIGIKESVHTTYAAYDMRNKVVKNMGRVFSAIQEKFQLPKDVTDEIELLEEGDGLSRNKSDG